VKYQPKRWEKCENAKKNAKSAMRMQNANSMQKKVRRDEL
jgi:hypothetical protein